MFISILSLAAAAQTPSDQLNAAWPEAKPERVLASPDWTDYRIYPKAAAHKNEEGRVHAETIVSSDGRPVTCRIVESSGYPDLDEGTCDLFMQMRFLPARDQKGQTIPSHYEAAVTWRMSDALPFASALVKARIEVRGGKLTACHAQGGEGPFASLWTTAACSYASDVGYFLGEHANEDGTALIEVRLDAGDGATFLRNPWLAGSPIAVEQLTFRVSGGGDPVECTPLLKRGFGPRGMRTMSPCGPFLADLYFSGAAKGTGSTVRRGQIETRVYLVPKYEN